jgi:hypothetical protein
MATPNVFTETQERNQQSILTAVASEEAPVFVEERAVPLSVDKSGNLRVVVSGGLSGSLYNYTTSVKEQDDFISGNTTSTQVGKLGWGWSGGAGVYSPNVANHPGIFTRSTGASGGTVAYTYLVPATGTGHNNGLVNGAYTVTYVVRVDQADTDTAVRVGVMQTYTADPPDNGMYFEKLYADTNWFAVTRSSSTQTGTRTDTNVAVSTDFIVMTVERASATVTTYYLDGVLVATHSSNIYTGLLNPSFHIINQSGTKTLSIDYFELDRRDLTR